VATHETTIHPFPAQARVPKQVLLDPTAIVREGAALACECRLAIFSALLSNDELVGRLRASIVEVAGRPEGLR
jgi:hypothetical protein